MPQLCNVIYARLSQGMNTAERSKLDTDLAPPQERELHLGRQNQAAMQQLGGLGVLPPARKK